MEVSPRNDQSDEKRKTKTQCSQTSKAEKDVMSSSSKGRTRQASWKKMEMKPRKRNARQMPAS
jgi:hypothetical protein